MNTSQLSASEVDADTQEISEINNELLSPTDSFIITNSHLFCMFAFWWISCIIRNILKRSYPKLQITHLINCTMHSLKLLVITTLLGVHLAAYIMLKTEVTQMGYQLSRLASLLTVDLVLFDLIYRPHLDLVSVLHNVMTIFITGLLYYFIVELDDIDLCILGLVLLFQVDTAQPTTLGLLFYRLKREWAARMLNFGAIQGMLTTIASSIWAFTIWAKFVIPETSNKPLFSTFNTIFPITWACLFIDQLWVTYVILSIAERAGGERKRISQITHVKADWNASIMNGNNYGFTNWRKKGESKSFEEQ